MEPLDGAIFVASEDFYFAWDQAGQTMTVTYRGEVQVVQATFDIYGRLEFIGSSARGWIDVDGSLWHMLLDTEDDPPQRWMGEGPKFPVVPVPGRKVCICQGTLELCSGGDNDCQNNETCTRPAGTNARCAWGYIPVTEPDGCGNQGAGGWGLLGMTLLPATLVPKLLRRRRAQK
jgi:hypothetical protein